MKGVLNNPKLPVLAVIISFVVWSGLYFGLYLLGWPGEAHVCVEPPYCFCETVHQGALAAQKSNTWSDLGFVIAAIFIAFHGGRFLRQPGTTNPNTEITYGNNSALIALYAAVIFYMGPGSMFFHGAMTNWGGWMDVISMYLFVFYIISYLTYRSWNLTLRFFFLMYFLLSLFAILISVFAHNTSAQVFPLFAAFLIALALLQMVPISKLKLGRSKNLPLNHKWLLFAFGFFGVALAIWTQSDTGKWLCYPDSLLQGHAAWHLLSACMTVCVHFYFISEMQQLQSK